MDDDYTYDLFWHALNYRTAGPKEAEAMWRELQACSERITHYELESALAKSESRNAELEAELMEQCRLLGMSGSREAALMEKLRVAEDSLVENDCLFNSAMAVIAQFITLSSRPDEDEWGKVADAGAMLTNVTLAKLKEAP